MFNKRKKTIINFDDFVDLLKVQITLWTGDMLDQQQGEDETTLREFLENKIEGSEWTDQLGFKVKIEKGKYILD